jgi:hypothetical protein
MDGQIEARNGSEVIHLAGALALMCQKAFSVELWLLLDHVCSVWLGGEEESIMDTKGLKNIWSYP